MAQVIRQNAAPLTDHIIVTLQKEDYYPAFEKNLKNYSKQANIPGFRKGMVPTGVVKKMYGASVFADEVLRTVEKEVNAFLEKENPEIFGQPLPIEANADTVRGFNMNEPGEYTFTFEIGLKPDFTPADLAKASIKRMNVTVTDEMVEEEIERLRNRFGNMKEPETVTTEDNVLNISFTQVDADGNEVEGGIKHETNSLLVKYFAESVRPELIGLKVGESITKTLGEAFEEKEFGWVRDDLGQKDNPEAANLNLLMTITKIGLVEKREMNEEFFNQIFPGRAIATEAEFREALREDIGKQWAQQARGQVQDEIYHYLLDHTNLEFPEDFLKRWIMQSGKEQKTAEQAEAEFPKFKNQLKWTLISDHFIKQQNLDVQMEELRAYAKTQMMSYMGVTTIDESMAWLDSYVDRMMQDKKYIDENYHRLLTEKLFGWAESQVQYNDVTVSAEEFLEKQHHHHH
ncbi:MAG: trigger factor [Chitinophagaceae bacterium]|nr:trigger factor [Chitinophagaceae bacterium]